MNPLDLLPWWAKALIVAALVAAGSWGVHTYNESLRDEGRAEKQAEWNARDLAQSQAAGRETLRRMDRQQENQHAYDKELAAARRDAAVNAADADRVREQAAEAARRWGDYATTDKQCAPAADAINVCADLFSRADKRASDLAAYADTARIAGLKCERDYDALTPPKQ